MRELDGVTDLMDLSLGRLQEIVNDKGSLACCSPWDLKELDMPEGLNNNNNNNNMKTKIKVKKNQTCNSHLRY